MGDVASVFYRLADGVLELSSDDGPLADRFQEIFGDCRASGPSAGLAHVVCCVRVDASSGLARIALRDGDSLSPLDTALLLLAERGYREGPRAVDGWRSLLEPEHATPVLFFNGWELRAPPSSGWRPVVANLALARVLRPQSHVLFLHAASLNLGGRGALLAGPKGSGKTTLSVELAARGHGLLGDELAAVRRSTLELVALRRAVGLRSGPASGRVRQRLATASTARTERYPDGATRTRVSVADLFPGSSSDSAPLTDVVFLREFGERPRLATVAARPEHVSWLGPLAGLRDDGAMPWLQLLSRVRCHALVAGPPEETAALLEAALHST